MMGIVKGDGSGNYGENKNVTKEEFAVMLARSFTGLPQGSSDGIADFEMTMSDFMSVLTALQALQQ